jgi:hypothetical protein
MNKVVGQIEVTAITGQATFIIAAKAAGVVELEKETCRILFDGGGHIDVLGDAEIIRRNIAIERLEESKLFYSYRGA